MQEINISIIIPSYNSEGTLRQCLDSIACQRSSLGYEIIIVDSSLHNRAGEIAAGHNGVKFIKLEERTFSGIARNKGIEAAEGELLIFMDADVVIPEGFLDSAFSYYKSGHDVFMPSIDIWHKERARFFEKIEWFFEFDEYKPSMKEGSKWSLPSTLLCVKKELLGKEKFSTMKRSQDVEFTVRLSKNGNRLYFNPRLRAFHIFYLSFKAQMEKAFADGAGSMVIRRMHNLTASGIIRNNFLAFFAIPFFAIIKFINISWYNLRYNNWKDRTLYICALPIICCLIIAWMSGAYAGRR